MELNLTLRSMLVYLRKLTLLHEMYPYVAQTNDSTFDSALLSVSQRISQYEMRSTNFFFSPKSAGSVTPPEYMKSNN